MTEDKLTIMPCYESRAENGPYAPFARLHGAMSDEALRDYFHAQCAYGEGRINPATLQEGADNLVGRWRLILSGGLILKNGAFLIRPGCCCGIESWSAWRDIKKDGPSPWTGHDPEPWIDTSGERGVFHSDLDRDANTVEVGYDEIQSALDGAEEDLRGFLSALKEWLQRNGVENAAAVAEKIREAYGVPA